jgi:hypothetical protein
MSKKKTRPWGDFHVDDAFRLRGGQCPCYCSGQGVLVLVTCPACLRVVGRCDEVEEMIRSVHNPEFDGESSLCHPENPCPFCENATWGQFRAATEEDLARVGLRPEQYGPYR